MSYLRRNHLALLALFIALGGTSYAATQLPANSVGTRQIRDSSVTKAKLSDSLRQTLARVSPEPAAGRGAAGPTGPAGSAGAPGAPGANGAPGTVSTARAYGYETYPANPCPPGAAASCGPLQAVNASFDAAISGSPAGTFCIRPGADIDPSTAVLVVSAFNPQAPIPSGEVLQAQWVYSAPDCPSGDLEVQTSAITADSSGLDVTPAVAPFSFVIP